MSLKKNNAKKSSEVKKSKYSASALSKAELLASKQNKLDMNYLLKWHYGLWQSVTNRLDNLSHSCLFYGIKGIAKADFVGYLTKRMLCSEPKNNLYCNNCLSCSAFDNNEHLDLLCILGRKDVIKIDDIRQISEFVNLTTNISDRKIIIIEEAQNITIQAANALLKSLEEPPEKCYFFLTSSYQMQILPTIRSRCTQIFMSHPDYNSSLEFLKEQVVQNKATYLKESLNLSQGAPLKALDLIQNDTIVILNRLVDTIGQIILKKTPYTFKDDLIKDDPFVFIDIFLSLINNVLKIKLLNNYNGLEHNESNKKLYFIANQLSISLIFLSYDELIDLKRLIVANIAVNTKMSIERILSRFYGIYEKKAIV